MPPIIQVIILIEKGSSTSTQIYSGATIEKNLPITIRKSVNSDDEQDIFVEWEIDILKNLDSTKLYHPSDLLFFSQLAWLSFVNPFNKFNNSLL